MTEQTDTLRAEIHLLLRLLAESFEGECNPEVEDLFARLLVEVSK